MKEKCKRPEVKLKGIAILVRNIWNRILRTDQSFGAEELCRRNFTKWTP